MKEMILAVISMSFVFFLSLIFRKKSLKQTKNPEPELDSELNFAPAGHMVTISLLKNSKNSEEESESDFSVLEKIGYFIGAANDGQKTAGYSATPLQDVDPKGFA